MVDVVLEGGLAETSCKEDPSCLTPTYIQIHIYICIYIYIYESVCNMCVYIHKYIHTCAICESPRSLHPVELGRSCLYYCFVPKSPASAPAA